MDDDKKLPRALYYKSERFINLIVVTHVMGIEKLTENSTPCEICRELGLRDPNVAETISEYDSTKNICYRHAQWNNLHGHGYDVCLQSDRALIKLMYLNLVKKD